MHLWVLMVGLLSLHLPSLARADAAPASGGCDCNLAPKSDPAETSRKRRLGLAAFAVFSAGSFCFFARQVRRKNAGGPTPDSRDRGRDTPPQK